MSTHNLCFGAKIRKQYHCKPQLYYIKVGCKGCSLHGLVFVITAMKIAVDYIGVLGIVMW